MKLIVLRHAEAVDAGAHPGPDAGRPLTEDGREGARRAGRVLEVIDSVPDVILTSPLLRAVQTAEEVAGAVRKAPRPEVFEPLAAGAEPARLLARLAARAPDGVVLIVGHEPDLGLLLEEACSGRASGAFPFRKAGLALLEFEGPPSPAGGRLSWLLPPKIQKRLLR